MEENKLIEKLFAPGNKILVEFADDQKAIKSYQTTVEDLEGAYLVLQAPLTNNVPVKFRESQELTLRQVDKQKQEAYVTNVFVIDVRQSKVPLLVCSKPIKIDKTSLRRFSRFGVNLPFKYKSDKHETARHGRINDLSLSGCYALIEADPLVKAGTVLEFTVSMPGEGSVLTLSGRVIRTDQPVEGGDDLTGIAFDFEGLSKDQLETLYYYIFQLQLTSDSILGSGLEVE